jgi:hypothetical protein
VESAESIETGIAEWRAFVEQGPAVEGRDVDELETHLREQIADLRVAGLDADEAFLVAVKRMGRVDDLADEFAREHSGRLWRQLVVVDDDDQRSPGLRWLEALVFAALAAVAMQVARLAAGFPEEEPLWLARNATLFVLPFLAGYFAWERRLDRRRWLLAATPFAVAALVVNLYPYDADASTELLVSAHLPVVLWFVVAYPYMGGLLGSRERRMDFVRFTGEWSIYYVLIGLGGGVLLALTALILEPTGVADPAEIVGWLLLPGAAGAVVVAAWLVEAKQRIVENMAPVLTLLFTPLFAVVLAGSAVVYAVTAPGGTFDRELLGVFNALMVVVLGLVLYGMSARGPAQPPGWMDRTQVVAVVSALVLDVMVLASLAARISDLGWTPNRAAALGLNLVLLVDLAGSAWLSVRFLRGRGTFHRLERWQTTYLPVFPAWAATVVVVFPPAFGFS